MASSTRNVKLGVCKVTFNAVDLGYTQGGVEVSVTTETHKVNVDQFGKTPVNEYVMGRSLTVKVPMAETTLDNLVKIMPGATLITDGVDPDKKYVKVTHGVGNDLLETAKALVLHPTAKADDDKSEDFTVPLANTAGALQFAYKLDQERIFNVEFTGYADPATGLLFEVGDTTAVPAP